MSKETLVAHLTPLISFLRTLDFNAADATSQLNHHYPVDGDWSQTLKQILIQHQDAEWLFPNEHREIRYGQLDDGQLSGFSIDSVDMNKAGPSHLHIEGEVDIAFAIDGNPTFDGRPEGWTVYPPNSWHRPTVRDGRMLILYFLPNGALQFCRAAPEGARVY